MVRVMSFAVFTSILTAGILAPGIALASCTEWMDQGDGTSWAECVDDNGVQHCWVINNAPGSTAREVSCSQ